MERVPATENEDAGQQNSYFLVASFRQSRSDAERRTREALDTSSSGDDRLSEAFGIDKSLTLTPRVFSLNASDPQVEQPPTFAEKFLRFLHEEDEPKPTNFRLSDDFKTKISKLCKKPLAEKKKLPDFSIYSTTDSRQKFGSDVPNNKNEEGSLIDDVKRLRLSSKSISPNRNSLAIHSSIFSYSQFPSHNSLKNHISGSFQSPNELGSYSFGQKAAQFDVQPQSTPKNRNINHKGCKVNSLDYIIDPERIEHLQLTTLYIANIPNKYTKKMLMKLIDDKFLSQYDFFYLPIDFENKCNVGYAFINFMNLEAVNNFLNIFHKKKWPKFNSNKICEIRYAKIQGKENCIKHFANSCLMKQPEDNLKPFVRFSRQK